MIPQGNAPSENETSAILLIGASCWLLFFIGGPMQLVVGASTDDHGDDHGSLAGPRPSNVSSSSTRRCSFHACWWVARVCWWVAQRDSTRQRRNETARDQRRRNETARDQRRRNETARSETPTVEFGSPWSGIIQVILRRWTWIAERATDLGTVSPSRLPSTL